MITQWRLWPLDAPSASPRETGHFRHVAAAALGWAAAVYTPITEAGTVLKVEAWQGASGIEAALAVARDARRGTQPLNAPVRVVLEPGEYTLTAPLHLSADDAGTSAAPLVIEARVPGSVILSGAPRLQAAELDGERWRFTPPQRLDRDAERSGGQFYVNGHRATLARTPNNGAMWLVSSGDGDSLVSAPADRLRLGADLAGQRDRAIVHLMQSWTSGRHAVASYDSSTGRLQLAPKPRWPFLKFGPKQRYYVENLPAALDEPGEWVAAEGAIQYLPTAMERSAARAQAPTGHWPRLPQLLTVQGTADRPVRHVRIQGLTFAFTGIPQPASGWVDNQAAGGIAAAVEVNHASDLVFTRNAWQHLGGYALALRNGVSNSEISHNLLEDLGAGGIRVGGEGTPGPRNRTSKITIQGNVLRDTGREFPGAVAIWIGRSFGNTVEGNIVARTSYTGISVGWAWGYEDPSSGDNLVANNLLFDIGQQELSDLGAIYTLGRSPGTVVRGNYVRNVEDYVGYGAGAWGIYNDEGSADLLVEHNVVVNTRSGGYQLHYGRDITVRGNLFAGGRGAEVRWANVGRSGAWRLERNGIGTDASSGSRVAAGRAAFEWHKPADAADRSVPMPSFALGAGANLQPVRIGAELFDVTIDSSQQSGATVGAEQVAAWQATLQNARRLYDSLWRPKARFPWP